MLLVFETREEPRFAESVDLDQLNRWKKLPGAAYKLRRDWRSAITHYFKAAQVVHLSIGELCEQVEHRGH
jgi:hypothetical protein